MPIQDSTQKRNNITHRGEVKALRRGKWIPEEETFASAIIDAFKLGCLENVADGSTLRSVLSKKLMCSAMRVSKKYAGGLIGKLTFIERDNSEETIIRHRQNLVKLEKQFRDALIYSKPTKFVAHQQPASKRNSGPIASMSIPPNARCFGDVFPTQGVGPDQMFMPVFIPFTATNQSLAVDQAVDSTMTIAPTECRKTQQQQTKPPTKPKLPSPQLSPHTDNMVGEVQSHKRGHCRGASFETQSLKISRKDLDISDTWVNELGMHYAFGLNSEHPQARSCPGSREHLNSSKSQDEMFEAMMISFCDLDDDANKTDDGIIDRLQ